MTTGHSPFITKWLRYCNTSPCCFCFVFVLSFDYWLAGNSAPNAERLAKLYHDILQIMTPEKRKKRGKKQKHFSNNKRLHMLNKWINKSVQKRHGLIMKPTFRDKIFSTLTETQCCCYTYIQTIQKKRLQIYRNIYNKMCKS